jgi:hypothetical protein
MLACLVKRVKQVNFDILIEVKLVRMEIDHEIHEKHDTGKKASGIGWFVAVSPRQLMPSA